MKNHTDIAARAEYWLEKLVAFDSRNGIGEEEPIASFLKEALAGFSPDHLELGFVPRERGKTDGAWVMAGWGRPDRMINVHLDTVPSGEGWTASPFALRRDGNRLIGLGTSDIKGAIASTLAALEDVTPRDVAVLFSGDEEQGSEVMSALVETEIFAGIKHAVVCEPTGCHVGVRHRGMLAMTTDFSGPGGHSSLSDITPAPLSEAARLASLLAEFGFNHLEYGPDGFKGLCLNLGRLDSDGAYNVIPTHTKLSFSLRPPPGDDVLAREGEVRRIITESFEPDEIDTIVAHPAFATADLETFRAYFGELCNKPLDLPYWTEAALLSEKGINCVVFGPGNLEQAHTANEYVTANQLKTAAEYYRNVLS